VKEAAALHFKALSQCLSAATGVPTGNLSKDRPSLGQDSNLGISIYETVELTTTLKRFVRRIRRRGGGENGVWNIVDKL
jgi:hypothetical protein